MPTCDYAMRRWLPPARRWPEWSSEELAKLARLLGRMADDFTAVAHE
jgi:hypothetical protein